MMNHSRRLEWVLVAIALALAGGRRWPRVKRTPERQPPRAEPPGNSFYRGGSERCDPICDDCRSEERRAGAYIVMAMCGSVGAAATGAAKMSGYGKDADWDYVVRFCKEAFGDKTDEEQNARIKSALDRAMELMRHEGKTASAVAKE